MEVIAASIEAFPEPLLLFDATGKVVWINQAYRALSGYSRDAIAELPAALVLIPRSGSATVRPLQAVLTRCVAWTGEVYYHHRDGGHRAGWLSIAALPDAGGGHLALLRDPAG